MLCNKKIGGFADGAKAKTYNSGDSLVVTHLTTNPPVHCLYMAERTGSLIKLQPLFGIVYESKGYFTISSALLLISFPSRWIPQGPVKRTMKLDKASLTQYKRSCNSVC
jgi:hypothetical protein